MNRSQRKRSRRQREQRLNRVLVLVFAGVLFVGLFSQVAMVARLSGQAKASRQVEREIRDLSANADNLNLSLNQYRSLDRITALAKGLGMEQPTEGQIRVVSLPGVIGNTSTQSAENLGAEEMK